MMYAITQTTITLINDHSSVLHEIRLQTEGPTMIIWLTL